MSAENNNGYKPPIIDHVPTAEELAKVGSAKASDKPVSRKQLDDIMHSIGFNVPERPAPGEGHTPAGVEPFAIHEVERDTEFHTEPISDQTMMPEDLRDLRSEIAAMSPEEVDQILNPKNS
jgi:hypothetical protein